MSTLDPRPASVQSPAPARLTASTRRKLVVRILEVMRSRAAYLATLELSGNSSTIDASVNRYLDCEAELHDAIRETGFDGVTLRGRLWLAISADQLAARMESGQSVHVCELRTPRPRMVIPEPMVN